MGSTAPRTQADGRAGAWRLLRPRIQALQPRRLKRLALALVQRSRTCRMRKQWSSVAARDSKIIPAGLRSLSGTLASWLSLPPALSHWLRAITDTSGGAVLPVIAKGDIATRQKLIQYKLGRTIKMHLLAHLLKVLLLLATQAARACHTRWHGPCASHAMHALCLARQEAPPLAACHCRCPELASGRQRAAAQSDIVS